MNELIRSNDLVLIGFAQSLLEGADHAAQARRLLTEAGLAAELRDA
jgi:hypothetical protein